MSYAQWRNSYTRLFSRVGKEMFLIPPPLYFAQLYEDSTLFNETKQNYTDIFKFIRVFQLLVPHEVSTFHLLGSKPLICKKSKSVFRLSSHSDT
jgi:hypothetical protein